MGKKRKEFPLEGRPSEVSKISASKSKDLSQAAANDRGNSRQLQSQSSRGEAFDVERAIKRRNDEKMF